MKKFFVVFSSLIILYSVTQAQKKVSGRVVNSRDGSPLAGVSVNVKGGKPGTTTDESGQFQLMAAVNDVLVFSNVGFTEKEVVVPDNEIIDLKVELDVAQNNLQEVVVTGYTTQNRRQVTGSVSKLSGSRVRLQPVGSFDKALQGKVPGLLSLSQTGQPGAPADVTIRGRGSINGSNTPLYIIDGVQVNSADFASINPSDIESFTVLKDASATSIYGSRGANGVIVITTKKGTPGKTVINYDFQYGFSRMPTSQLKLMNSPQKLDYEVNFDRPIYGKNYFQWTPEQIDSLSQIDNMLNSVLFQRGITQQHVLSASGGNDKTKFFLSGSFFDQEGVVITTGLRRYTGRANIENSFGNWRVGLNTTFGYSRLIGTNENDAYIGSPLNAIKWFNPYITLFDENGDYQDDFLQGQPNPLRELLENHGNNDQLKGIGNVFVEFNLPWVKGLRLKTLWGGDFTSDESLNYLDKTTDAGGQATGGNGSLTRTYSKNFRYTGTTSVTYQRSFNEHEISASLFNEIIQERTENFGYTGYGLTGPFKNEAGITPGTPANGYIPVVGGSAAQSSLLSYFIDANYGYLKKYYISAGFRRDGSSRFGENHKWANFGQVGLSWIMSEERFLESSRGWLNELKFKISYGSVGNQLGIGNYASRELHGPAAYNGVGGSLVLTNLANPDLRWEKKLIFNTGIEFTTFDGRFGGTIEYYNNITKDLFLDRQLSRTSGFPSINTNLGRMQNQGIEVSFSADIIRTKNFTWSISANHTYNKNKILEQPGLPENINGLFINKEGERANSLYVTRYVGVDAQTGEALYLKKDGKSITNIYDPSDAVIVGTVDPPHFGGFSTNLTYKGIGLEVLFSYAFGNVIYNNDRTNVEYSGYWYSRLAVSMLREWQKPGDVTDIPSPFNDFHSETDRFVEKADFLRLRNVMLSYDLPQSLMRKWHMNSLRVYAQGQNLHVWHSVQSYDPEITTGILTGAHYPQLQTITFGLTLGL
jgi:TonB-dependent starch-binding outer membrane protein SusC